MYRVGPLARLNICDFAGTPRADRELRQFRRLAPTRQAGDQQLLLSLRPADRDPVLPGEDRGNDRGPGDHERTYVRARPASINLIGVGVSEAPRGTLFHEYHVNEDGILQKVNLIIATGQNNLAMNQTVQQIAQAYINGTKLTEGMLNRIEHGIRLYDPCLSCSTHAVGQMPMDVELIGARGGCGQASPRRIGGYISHPVFCRHQNACYHTAVVDHRAAPKSFGVALVSLFCNYRQALSCALL